MASAKRRVPGSTSKSRLTSLEVMRAPSAQRIIPSEWMAEPSGSSWSCTYPPASSVPKMSQVQRKPVRPLRGSSGPVTGSPPAMSVRTPHEWSRPPHQSRTSVRSPPSSIQPSTRPDWL